jgi:cytochrome c oxidase assembly factor CtaG
MFFASALLLWWHIIGAAPRIHKGRSYLVRMVIVALAFFQNLIVGITITMWGDVIYKHYLDVPRLWNITPKDDQTFGGLIMWLGGGMMYMMTLLILIGLYISEASRKSRAKEKLQKQHKASLA